MVLPQEDGRGEGVCAICQELLKEAVSTECGHRFCRGCLARHVAKASASGVLCCPLCRKPCSEGVLGPGYLCSSHQKKVCYFCEESRLLVCGECLASPEHQGHCELAVGDAVNHYKVRPGHHLPQSPLLPSAHTGSRTDSVPVLLLHPTLDPCPGFSTIHVSVHW